MNQAQIDQLIHAVAFADRKAKDKESVIQHLIELGLNRPTAEFLLAIV